MPARSRTFAKRIVLPSGPWECAPSAGLPVLEQPRARSAGRIAATRIARRLTPLSKSPNMVKPPIWRMVIPNRVFRQHLRYFIRTSIVTCRSPINRIQPFLPLRPIVEPPPHYIVLGHILGSQVSPCRKGRNAGRPGPGSSGTAIDEGIDATEGPRYAAYWPWRRWDRLWRSRS